MGLFRSRGRHTAPSTDEPTTAEQVLVNEAIDGLDTNLDPSLPWHRNVLIKEDGTWAYFVLGQNDYLFRTPDDRARVMGSIARRLAELEGLRVWLRGTTAPTDPSAWAKRIASEHPAPGEPVQLRQKVVTTRRPDPEEGRTFADMLTAAQIRQHELDARSAATVLGVRVSTTRLTSEQIRMLFTTDELPAGMSGVDEVRRTFVRVTKAVAGKGLAGAPISESALGWLIHASTGMGAPVPPALLTPFGADAHGDHGQAFTAPVVLTSSPYALTTRVRTIRQSRLYDKHVAVVHATTLADRDTDDAYRLPWLSWPNGLPYPVEWVAQFDVIAARDLRAEATYNRRKATNIAEHHAEHGDRPSATIMRGIERAGEIEDELQIPDKAIADRVHGVVMFALVGGTEDEALEIARRFESDAAEQQGITISHGYAQQRSLSGFSPIGRPIPVDGLDTQMNLVTLATAVPNASTSCGDATGFLVGPVAGGRDVMKFDPHGGSKRSKSNFVAVVGDPGSGKSSFLGALLDWEATLGIRSIGFDPSAQWQRLCDLPWQRGDARHLDLFSAHAGLLVPSTLIVEPNRNDYDTDETFRSAVAEAAAERKDLMVDVLRDLLPPAMIANDTGGRIAAGLDRAVNLVGGDYGADPWEVVARLKESNDENVRYAAEALEDAAQMKHGSLMFPPRNRDVDDAAVERTLNSATLTIITMKGLTLPPKDNPNRAEWDRNQRAALPLLKLGARLANRVMYADKAPKMIAHDEAGISTAGGNSMGSHITRAGFDSRKWNALVAVASQNPSTLADLNREFENLVGAAFIGRMDRKAAVGALPLLRLEGDQGHEWTISDLEQGEFLVRDWLGRVRKVAVDRGWWDHDLLAALDTNPHGENTAEDRGADLFEQRSA